MFAGVQICTYRSCKVALYDIKESLFKTSMHSASSITLKNRKHSISVDKFCVYIELGVSEWLQLYRNYKFLKLSGNRDPKLNFLTDISAYPEMHVSISMSKLVSQWKYAFFIM